MKITLLENALLASADQAYLLFDETNTIMLANQLAEQLFAYPSGKLIGTSLDKLIVDSAQMVKQIASQVQAQLHDVVGLTYPGDKCNLSMSLQKTMLADQPVVLVCVHDDMRFKRFEKYIDKVQAICNDMRLDVAQKIQRLLYVGIDYLEVNAALIGQANKSHNEFIISYCTENALGAAPGLTFSYDTTYCYLTLQRGGPLAMNDCAIEIPDQVCYKTQGTRCYLGMPLNGGDVIDGCVAFYSKEPRGRLFDFYDIQFIRLLSKWLSLELSYYRQASDSDDQQDWGKGTNTGLVHLAENTLTSNTPSTFHFTRVLQRACSRVQRGLYSFALLFVDFSDYEKLKAKYGAAAADSALHYLTQMLKNICRQHDFVSRHAGHEFLVILEGVTKQGQCLQFVKRLQFELSNPFYFHGRALDINVSIGITLAPQDSCDMQELMHFADHAKQLVLQLGIKPYVFYADVAASLPAPAINEA